MLKQPITDSKTKKLILENLKIEVSFILRIHLYYLIIKIQVETKLSVHLPMTLTCTIIIQSFCIDRPSPIE